MAGVEVVVVSVKNRDHVQNTEMFVGGGVAKEPVTQAF